MSNVIPIVSSSPPPLDDDGGWDDDDEDFGNFASAPSFATPSPPLGECCDQSQDDSFPVDWGNAVNASDDKGAFETTQVKEEATVNPDFINSVKSDQNCHSGVDSQIASQSHDDIKSVEFPVDFDNPPLINIPDTEELDLPTTAPVMHEKSNDCVPTKAGDANLVMSQPEPATNIISTSVTTTSLLEDSDAVCAKTNPSSTQPKTSPDQNCDNNVISIIPADTSGNNTTVAVQQDTCNSDTDHHSINVLYVKENSIDKVCDDISEEKVHNDDVWSNFDSAINTNDANASLDKDEASFADFNEHVQCHSDDIKTSGSDLSTDLPIHDDNCNNYEYESCASQENGDLNVPSVDNITDSCKDKSDSNDDVSNDTDSHISIVDTPNKQGDDSNVLDNVGEIRETDVSESATVSIVSDSVANNTSTEELCSSSSEVKVETELAHLNQETKDLKADCNKDCEGSPVENSNLTSDIFSETHEENGQYSQQTPDTTCEDNLEDKTLDKEEFKDENTISEGNDDKDNIHVENDFANFSETPEKETVCSPDEDANRMSDEDFGDFSCMGSERKTNDLSEEVTPISFRTSVCEEDEAVGGSRGDKNKSPEFADGEEDEDFGDFGDFSSSKAAAGADDFGDFGDFNSGNEEPSAFSSAMANDDDDFGDFGESAASGGADWANFDIGVASTQEADAGLSFESGVHQSTQDMENFVSITTQDQNTSKVASALEKCFPKPQDIPLPVEKSTSSNDNPPENDEGGSRDTHEAAETGDITALDVVVELGLANPQEARVQTWTVVQHPAKKDPQVRMWNQMKDVDSSHALGYAWPTSHCSQEIFCTLHIDTQNILFTQKKQAVPFFASGLGILEPTRGGSTPAEVKKEKTTPLKPTLLDTSEGSKQAPPANTQDIPPVDFDWSVSGLTNPLTANTLDLDFLLVQGSDSCEKTADEWDWVFKSDAENNINARSGLQPLEEMLKKSMPTAKLMPQEDLSSEAQRILAKMPDMSFMQSKVLMFPVKQ